MGALSRTKGAEAEREICRLLNDAGLPAQRTAPLQAWGGSRDADVIGIPGVFLEIKRQERIEIDKWCAQAELASSVDVPVVAWRRSRQPWRCALPLEDFLTLVKRASL